MRVTQGLMINNMLYDLRQSSERLQKVEEQLSTLKVLNRPSDNPVGTVSALRLRSQIIDINRYTSNIQDAQNWLDATESSLTSVSSVINRAITTATQANTGVLDASAREALGDQLDSLIREAADVANERFQGRSIFGGHRTTEKAAVLNTVGDQVDSVVLTTDAGEIKRQISDSSTLKVNNTATEVFGSAGNDIFADLIRLRQAVFAGDSAQISSMMGRLESHNDRVLGFRAEIGAKGRRLESDESRLGASKVEAQDLLSNLEDTDVARATVEFSAADNAYQATLAVTAKIIMPSLLDFLK